MTDKPRGVDGEIIFSWLHVSDIHIGHGDASDGWDQTFVLQALQENAAALVAENRVPRPSAIMVTGDVAFSGAVRDGEEYVRARDWLLGLGRAMGVKPSETFVVPGNHDVQLSADHADKNLARLVSALRGGGTRLDNVLKDGDDTAMLARRMANYLDFARHFGPACAQHDEDDDGIGKLYWRHSKIVAGMNLRIVGLNTALLSNGKNDLEQLQLGNAQLTHAFPLLASEKPTVTMVLSHHPLSGKWLADEDVASSRVKTRAQIHLSGHIHEAQADQIISGGGSSLVSVSAGAAHADPSDASTATSHGYNFGALVRSPAGEVHLYVWPRRWFPKNADFRLDVQNTREGEEHSRHLLSLVRAQSAASNPAPAAAPVSSVARDGRPAGGGEEMLHAHTVEIWCGGKEPKSPSPEVASFFELFSGKQGEPRSGNIFDRARETIAATSDAAVLPVDGPPGIGKSTLLRALYAHLRDRRRKSAAEPTPVLIDTAVYDPLFRDGHPRAAIGAALRRHLAPLSEEVAAGTVTSVILLVDGLDAERPFREELLREIRAIRETCGVPVKWVAANRNDGSIKPLSFFDSEQPLLVLTPLRVDNGLVESTVDKFLQMEGKRQQANLYSSLVAQIKRYQLERIDVRLLNLLMKKMSIPAYASSDSISSFLYNHCKETLGGRDDEEGNALAHLAFRLFVQRDATLNLGGLMAEPKVWELLQFHTLLQEVLVAHHVVRLLRVYAEGQGKAGPEEVRLLEYVYPSTVMRRIRETVNAGSKDQAMVVNALKRGESNGTARMLAVICYLAGRLRDKAKVLMARPLLEGVIQRFGERAREGNNESLLVLRSAYVSLMSLGSEERGREYIQGLLQNKTWDNLNRGFHLEYYGDIPFDPGEPMCHEDDLAKPATRTLDHLLARVGAGLQKPRTVLLQLEAYTLCSLARHRHARGATASTLSQNHRAQLRALLPGLLAKGELFIPEVRDYIAATKIDLDIDDFRVGVLAEVLYRLKAYPRTGWTDRGIADAESVASHILGAYLLGLFFLPSSGPPGYEKQEILNTVLIHDLAEAITGDIPMPKKSRTHVDAERRWMSYLALSSTYDDVDEEISRIRGRFEAFFGKTDLNARIARELDKLDNLVQLFLYKRRGEEIKDFDEWRIELANQISTEQGERVRRVILEHFGAETQPASLQALEGPQVRPDPSVPVAITGERSSGKRLYPVSAIYRRSTVEERVQWKARIRKVISDADKHLLIAARTLDEILPPKKRSDGLAATVINLLEKRGKVFVMLANTFDDDAGFKIECKERDPGNPRPLYRATRDTVIQLLDMAREFKAYDRLTVRLSKMSPAYAMFMTEHAAVIEPYLPYREGGEGMVFEINRDRSHPLGDKSLPGARNPYDAHYLSFRKLFEKAEPVYQVLSRYHEARPEGTAGAYQMYLPPAEEMAKHCLDLANLDDGA